MNKRTSLYYLVCLLFIGIFALAACGSSTGTNPEPAINSEEASISEARPTTEPNPTNTPTPTNTPAPTDTPPPTKLPVLRTIIDVHGEEVMIMDDSAIIALDGPVTEIVYALGAADRLVATDVSSTYPETATQLPQVGYVRRLSAEPILAMAPSLLITTDSAGPPEAIAQLRESGVAIAMFKSPETVEESYQLIRDVAATLGLEEAGEKLVTKMEEDLAEAAVLLAQIEGKPRVMFIYARGLDSVSAAGTGTSIETMLEMAGATNAITEWEGYQPLTSESAVALSPDALLLFTSGLESIGGAEGLLTVPGLAETPAGLEGRIFNMDGLKLSGLGPRTGEAVIELIYMLHPELTEES